MRNFYDDHNSIFRIISFFVVYFVIVWGYWWVTWALIIILLFVFPLYYEIIFWGVLYDALYGVALPQFYNSSHIFTISSIVLFIIVYFLKKYVLTVDSYAV